MDQIAPPANRQELVDRLADLRQQGILDASEESELLRHFDDMLRDVEAEKAQLEPAYLKRVAEDGEEPAKQWLVEQAEALGRRVGQATREITDRLRVVTG